MKTSLHTDNSRKSKSVANNLSSQNTILQTKLKVGKPDDKYEQEADSVADRVMRMPENQIQRQNEEEELAQPKLQLQRKEEDEEEVVQAKLNIQRQVEEEEEEAAQPKLNIQKQEEEEEEPVQAKLDIQRQTEEEEEPVQAKSFLQNQQEKDDKQLGKVSQVGKDDEKETNEGLLQRKNYNPESNGRTSLSFADELNSRKGAGSSLPESTRTFMENRIGADFSRVRIHSDSSSANLSRKIKAQAFTTGNNIFFNQGKYNPDSSSGKHLLAHELTHVVQQGAAIRRKQNNSISNGKGNHYSIQNKSISGGTVLVQRGLIDDIAGGVSDIVSSVSRAIGSGITTAYRWINNIAHQIGGGITTAWSWIRQTATILRTGVLAAWNWASDFAAQVRMGVKNAIRWISGIAREISSGIFAAVRWALNLGRQLFRSPLSAVDWIRSIAGRLRVGLRMAFNWVNSLSRRIGMGISEAWNWVERMAGELATGILQAFDWLVNVAIHLAMGVIAAWNWLKRLARYIQNLIRNAWNFIRNVDRAIRFGLERTLSFLINLALTTGIGLIVEAWNWIRRVASRARMYVLAVYRILVTIARTIGGLLTRAWNWIRNVARRIRLSILHAWRWILRTAKKIGMAVQRVWNFLVDLARRIGRSIFETVDWWLNAPSISHKTVRFAPDGTSSSRSEVGVGETVKFTGSKIGRWKATNGTPAALASGLRFRWTAPNRAANARISLESGKYTIHVDIRVTEPNNITARKIREVRYRRGRQGAGMKLDFNYHPKKVSFSNLMAREVSGPASNIKGYYRHDGSAHYHNSGDTYFNIDLDNSLEPNIQDSATQSGYPSPWYKGSFRWIIPNRFKVKTESGDGKEFTRVTQAFTIFDRTGKTKITKAGAEVERTP